MEGSFWDRWNPLVIYRSECGGWFVRIFYRGFHVIPY